MGHHPINKKAVSQGNTRIIKRDTTYEGQSNRIGLVALAEDLGACSALERRRRGQGGCDSQKRKTQRKNCQQGFRGEHFLYDCEAFGEEPREGTPRWQEMELDWLPYNGLAAFRKEMTRSVRFAFPRSNDLLLSNPVAKRIFLSNSVKCILSAGAAIL